MAIEAVAKIWMDGELVDWADAKVHVLTHGLHYGTGVLEGIRAYETDNGPAIFRLTDHLKRLHASAKIMYMDVPYSVEELVAACKDTMRANELTSCYIRPLVYIGYGEMGLNPLNNPVQVTIATWNWGAYLGEDAALKGIRLHVSSWQRSPYNVIPPAAKTTAAYVNSAMAKVSAIKAGYDDAIMLNSQGHVAEVSAANVFAIHDGVITTPPPSAAGALRGMRRDSVITVARDLGLDVREQNMVRSDLYVADEVFVTGSASEVAPVRSIDDREIGEPGPVTRQILDKMHDVVRGRDSRYDKWIEYV